ncbi:protein eva-1 homolog B [Erythrolamprus reginae]|uniref:protein eva-1 homolog B n=1 Tax=Erythrolamprus reginae TaxID=121349 RepID=UPI00396CF2FE
MEADGEGEMELLSSSMAAYAHIRDNLESVGLYFVLGVCFGLVLTLCLLVIHISWHPPPPPAKRPKSPQDLSEEEEEEEEEDTTDHALSVPPLAMTELPLGDSPSTPDGTLALNVFASAEELERAQRLEERERILREIWRNGQPDVLGTGTIGRVHYY